MCRWHHSSGVTALQTMHAPAHCDDVRHRRPLCAHLHSAMLTVCDAHGVRCSRQRSGNCVLQQQHRHDACGNLPKLPRRRFAERRGGGGVGGGEAHAATAQRGGMPVPGSAMPRHPAVARDEHRREDGGERHLAAWARRRGCRLAPCLEVQPSGATRARAETTAVMWWEGLPRQLTKGCDAAAWRCEDESRRGEYADRRESMSSWHSRAAPGSALETGAAAVRSGLLLDDNR